MATMMVTLNEGCTIVCESEGKEREKWIQHMSLKATKSKKVRIDRFSIEEIKAAKENFKALNPNYPKRTKVIARL